MRLPADHGRQGSIGLLVGKQVARRAMGMKGVL